MAIRDADRDRLELVEIVLIEILIEIEDQTGAVTFEIFDGEVR